MTISSCRTMKSNYQKMAMYRVLYVDDESDLLDIGKLFLEDSGDFTVTTALSAAEALRLLEQEKFDAIISDYQMPGMDGIQFLVEVRKSFGLIPFILFTGRGREEIVIQAINSGANFYLQKGGEPGSQFAELSHKIHTAVESYHAGEKIQSLNKLYSVLSATNKAIISIRTKSAFFSEICRILVETGGFRMAWIGLADIERRTIRPVTSAGHVDGYLDNLNISTEDVTNGRGPTGTAFRQGKYYFSNDITSDPRMEPWRENALKRGYLANAAFPFAIGTKNAGVISLYAPLIGFFDEQIIDLLDELAVDISFALKTIDEQDDREKAEKALKESEAGLRAILDATPFPVALVDIQDNNINYWSRSALSLFGHTAPTAAEWYQLAYPDPAYRQDVIDRWKPYLEKAKLSSQPVNTGEYRVTCRDGSVRICELYATFLADKLIVTFNDITERKRAEAKLRASEDAHSAMLNGITESAFLITPEGIVLAANKTVALRLGLERADELVGKNAFELLPEDAKKSRQIKIQKVLQSGQMVQFEDVRNGRVISQTIYPVKDPDGSVSRLAIFGKDITEQKQAEDGLRESEHRLNAAQRIAKVGDITWNVETGHVEWSDALYDLMQYDKSEKIDFSRVNAEIHHPDDLERVNKWLNDSIASGSDEITPNEYRIIRKDGTILFVHTVGVIHRDKGNQVKVFLTLQDITERKVAEEALRESDEIVRDIIEKNPMSIQIVDKDGFTLKVNHAFTMLFGSIPPSDFSIFADLKNKQPALEKLIQLVKNGEVVNLPDLYFNTHDSFPEYPDVPVWVRAIIFPLKDKSGKPERFVLMHENITERKLAEEALRESEDRFRQLFTRMPSAVAIYEGVDGGKDFIFKDFNAAAEKIEGIKKDDVIGKRVTQVFPGVRDFGIFAVFQRVWRTGEFEFFPSALYRDERDPGTWRENWIYKLASGEVIAIYNDITQRKRAEEAVWQSEKKYRAIFEKSVSGLFKTSPNGHLIDANDALAHMYGYSDAAEMLKADLDIGTHLYANPDDRKEVLRILAEKGMIENYEILHSKRDGTHFWGIITARTIRNDEGTVLFFEGSNIDISERKQAEEALHESARYTRNLIEVSLDPLVTISPEGKITDVNTATELVTGYSRDYLIGTDFSNYFTDLEKAKEGYRKVFDDGVVRDYPLEIRRRDGKTTPVLYNATIYPGESGTKQGVFAAARDITERKVAEEALHQANKKLNLLSSITRHDINNQLTVLMGYLAIINKKQPDPALNEYFVKVGNAAQRISSMIQFTKEYESIGVKAPTWQDCRTVIDTAAKQAQLGNVVVKNDLAVGSEVFADPLIVKVCYNLMDNAARYGGKITTIRFSVQEHDGDQIIVCEDDGDGVVAEEKEKIFERGFGKNTGMGLFLSREILSITGITIKEAGEPGKGARFEMTVPKGAWRFGRSNENKE